MPESQKCILYAIKILFICIVFSCVLFALSLWGGGICRPLRSYPTVATPSVTYVLDAGHGGKDGGAVGADGTTEKELNLALALRLRDYLQLCGTETLMTRMTDSLVCDESDPLLKGKLKMTDLRNRLELAERAVPSVFVSLHMNKFAVEKYSGLQVYFSKNHEDSRTIAQQIQKRVQHILQPENHREIKAAGKNIFLLDRLQVPAVLIECGFLSNLAEAERLKESPYQIQLSAVIADSLLAN